MTWKEFRDLVDRAAKGDRSTLSKLREALKSEDHPEWARWFSETLGNPANWLNSTLTRMNGNDNLATSEAIEAKLNQLRKELEGPNSTPIERLLVERAVHCWFIMNYYETICVQNKSLPIKQADFHSRRIDAAHKRFLSAVATLARVRKLALPSLQVNIGAAQVNLGNPGSGDIRPGLAVPNEGADPIKSK